MPPLRLRRLQLHLVEVPLKTPFKHAAHERRSSLNVVCGLGTQEDTWGWGECLPRTYVTGETAEQVFDEIAKLARSFVFPTAATPDEFVAMLEELSLTLLPQNPSARCAVEVALIDVGAKHFNLSAVDVIQMLARRLDVPTRNPAPVIHSGVVGEGSLWSITKKAIKMRLYGLSQIKVKVGTDLEEDVARLRRLRFIHGKGADLRVDANGAWDFETAVAAIGAMSTFNITSVEQPLAKGDEEHLPALRKAVRIPIALDESLTSLADAQRAITRGEADLFNIRLSKCGGVMSCLRIVAEAKRAGLGAWLGCMVGETGLLSSAGRAFAVAVDGLRHLEGAFDHHLLETNLTTEDVGFTRGGIGQPLAGPGLGVEIRPDQLMRWTKQWEMYNLPS